jgi:uncharacterized protein YceH (UPF0502 family)
MHTNQTAPATNGEEGTNGDLQHRVTQLESRCASLTAERDSYERALYALMHARFDAADREELERRAQLPEGIEHGVVIERLKRCAESNDVANLEQWVQHLEQSLADGKRS